MRPQHRTRSTRSTRTARIALLGATVLLLAACGGGMSADAPAPAPDPAPAPAAPAPEAPAPEEPALPPLELVVTTSILGDVVRAITGEDATVRVLMGPGVDPHGFAASAADAAALRDADLVVANGLLLEAGLITALEAAESDGVRVLTLADQVDPIEFEDGHEDHGHSHGHSHSHDHSHDDDHDHGEEDPHFWWDPMRMAMATELIGAALADVRPEVDWADRVAAYNAELMTVHDEMVALFATIPAERRRIITNHDSLGYLADRFGFEVIGTVIPGSTTMAEPNARDFARLIDLVVAEGVDAIFLDEFDTTRNVEAIRADAATRGTSIEFVRIHTDSLGRPGSGADTYLTMLIRTAERITEALAAA